jgi:hypothetical protein
LPWASNRAEKIDKGTNQMKVSAHAQATSHSHMCSCQSDMESAQPRIAESSPMDMMPAPRPWATASLVPSCPRSRRTAEA